MVAMRAALVVAAAVACAVESAAGFQARVPPLLRPHLPSAQCLRTASRGAVRSLRMRGGAGGEAGTIDFYYWPGHMISLPPARPPSLPPSLPLYTLFWVLRIVMCV